MLRFFNDYGQWIFRAVITIGIAAQLYLTQNFVTRSEFKAKTDGLASTDLSIKTSVADIATTLKIMVANQTRIDDHETRIRILENRQIDNISRVGALERLTDHIQQKLNSKP